MTFFGDIIDMDFWERLDKEIEAKSNRKTITSKAGVAPNAVHLWIKRRSFPSADVIVEVAKELKMSVEELVTGENSSESYSSLIASRPNLRNVVDRAAQLDDTQLRKLIRMIDACFADDAEAPPTQMATGS